MNMAINPFRQLNVIRNVSKDGRQVEDCYRLMYKKELWIKAYRNLTRHTKELPIDEATLQKVDKLITKLKASTFRFVSVKKIIPSKTNHKQSIHFDEKLVQEVMRLILTSIYEPIFSSNSYGYIVRVETYGALSHIQKTWKGLTWCIKGALKELSIQLDTKIIMKLLAKKIADRRFLLLIHNALQAGVMEQLQFYRKDHNIGFLAPTFANIYLHVFDLFMEKQMKHVEKDRKIERIKYVRYEDDFVIGIAGSKKQARQLKGLVGKFLQYELRLTLHEEKTLITHLRKRVPFLGYEFHLIQNEKVKKHMQSKSKRIQKHFHTKTIKLEIPIRKIKQYALINNYGNLDDFNITHRTGLINMSEIDILKVYNKELQTIANYYQLAHNYHHLKQLFYVAEGSFLKTLANKRRSTVSKVAKSLKKHKQGRLSLIQTDEKGNKIVHSFLRLKDIPKAKGAIQ